MSQYGKYIMAIELKEKQLYMVDNHMYYVMDLAHIRRAKFPNLVLPYVLDLDTGLRSMKQYDKQAKLYCMDGEADLKTLCYLYSDDKYGYFMERWTFDSHVIPLKVIHSQTKDLKENQDVDVLFYCGSVIWMKVHKIDES